jgi:hypothetical protein
MPLILGANSLAGGGYEVDNSLRFDDGSGDNLSASSFGTPTSATTYTLSWWVKKASNGEASYLFGWYDGSRTNSGDILFDSNDNLVMYHGSNDGNGKLLQPTQKFRDPSAWYHMVWSVDTTQSTASNRIKFYVNGTQITDFSSATYPNQNAESKIFHDTNNRIGSQWDGTTATALNGYLAEVVFIDGQQLTPSDFGEFDEDSGIWKPIDVSDLTFGNNGFYLEFKDSSALGDDTSGNSNDFTVNNLTSIDQTTDTPTNNFATMNPLDNYYAGSTFSNGNCDILTNGSNYSFNTATFALSSGKWYWEAKIGTNTTVNNMFGIADRVATSSTQTVGEFASSYSLLGTGRLYENNSFTNSWGSSYTTGDIMSVALDLDNNRLYFAKNGTWQNSADPTTGTGAVSITAPSSVTSGNGYYFPAFGDFSGSDDTDWLVNFGNPTFTISSGNSDANGYGNFEYAVPSGYYALCTKNLAEYG